MANEATIIELSGLNPHNFTVADGTNISKGTLLKLSSDPNTASASAADSDVYAGVAAADKEANDGATTLAVHVPGQGNIFDMTCGGAGVTLGAMVSLSGANVIKNATEAEFPTGDVIGQALETGSAAEVIRVRS